MAADWSSSPTWTTLGFKQTESFYFQYAYTGMPDGKGYMATATGNLDCDDTSIVYSMQGAVSGGKPAAVLVKPTNSD